MNYIEFRLIRESLHLSRKEFSELWNIDLDTLQRWENNEEAIPIARQDQLNAIDEEVEQAAENVVNIVVDEKEHYENLNFINVLAYNNTTYDGNFKHYKLHNAALIRAKHRLKRELKINLKIVEFDCEKYTKWRNGRPDTMALRSAWAALQ